MKASSKSCDLVTDGKVPKVGKFMINKARDQERKRDAALELEKGSGGYKKSKKEAKAKEADPHAIPKRWMLK